MIDIRNIKGSVIGIFIILIALNCRSQSLPVVTGLQMWLIGDSATYDGSNKVSNWNLFNKNTENLYILETFLHPKP